MHVCIHGSMYICACNMYVHALTQWGGSKLSNEQITLIYRSLKPTVVEQIRAVKLIYNTYLQVTKTHRRGADQSC